MLSHQHEIFLEVARLLSFTKASQALFVSQSAVSKQVKALEEYYKTGLFERLGNSILLTPAGELLYRKLLLAKQLQHELHQEFTTLSPTFSPQVHMIIGASTTISLYVIPPVLSAYLGKFPNTQLTLKNRNSENILKALLDHEIDLGIIEGIHKVSNVTYTPLLTDEVVAVCSARNPLNKKELRAQELLEVPVALRETGSGTLAVLEEALAEKHIRLTDLRVKVRLGGTEALKNFVRVDTCLAFLPRQAVMKELASGELVEVPLPDLNLVRHFDFVQRKGTENNMPYREFVQFARRHYAKPA
ncbi:DNA-binding transcriptional regulator, LysR family [Hymenobacter daecheongensis DSM 21074]|uniref:DNA-binding transcriptional regulator, LysR family n=1 Tax=Hymenobacter daecheongensis DSM 21074 TaxID=1121955 RepID=A0A1M6GR47_9BACT|nr:LysR family transcriptional regulator [Hymenobacter daecheongensis]SHJ12421.1 DNA-binding transcriptional regulator, LysR family [Hymenobacter daecheongensis DSM 21074]